MTDEQILGAIAALCLIVSERDSKSFLRIFAFVLCLYSIIKFGWRW